MRGELLVPGLSEDVIEKSNFHGGTYPRLLLGWEISPVETLEEGLDGDCGGVLKFVPWRSSVVEGCMGRVVSSIEVET